MSGYGRAALCSWPRAVGRVGGGARALGVQQGGRQPRTARASGLEGPRQSMVCTAVCADIRWGIVPSPDIVAVVRCFIPTTASLRASLPGPRTLEAGRKVNAGRRSTAKDSRPDSGRPSDGPVDLRLELVGEVHVARGVVPVDRPDLMALAFCLVGGDLPTPQCL